MCDSENAIAQLNTLTPRMRRFAFDLQLPSAGAEKLWQSESTDGLWRHRDSLRPSNYLLRSAAPSIFWPPRSMSLPAPDMVLQPAVKAARSNKPIIVRNMMSPFQLVTGVMPPARSNGCSHEKQYGMAL